MELSKRLLAVAGLVTEGASVADIGTDHGYIPIYLVTHSISSKVIAMDINKGPLERAKTHIKEQGLSDKIETRLSDGLSKLQPGEVTTMIAAGMGGSLVIHILEQNPEITASVETFILQPQSEIEKVRFYLSTNGFRVVAEDMVEEDGKFYPMMKMVRGEDEPFSEEELYYGRLLLKEKNPVLRKFLEKEQSVKIEIIESLRKQNTARATERIGELQKELNRIEEALKVYEGA